ncbi:MAG: GNAT family N-acetyltransferase [Janthinobacterium lividum]
MYKIISSTHLDFSYKESILISLSNQAKTLKNLDPMVPFAFSYFDEENNFIDGIEGYDIYGGLYIDLLFVADKFRKSKYGSKLANRAVELAIQRGCSFVHLSTMDFKARPFYEKLGFEVEYMREGYHQNSIMYY